MRFVVLLVLAACGGAELPAPGDGTGEQPVVPYTPPAGTFTGHAVLVTQTIDNPSGSLGCAIPDARYRMPDFEFPISNGCVVLDTKQDAYTIRCEYLGSGGLNTPEPNPRRESTFVLAFTENQRDGYCSYHIARGTMTDQDNWTDCRSHTWSVEFRQTVSCP